MASNTVVSEPSKPLPILMWVGFWVVLALGWVGFAVYYWLIAAEPGELTDQGLVGRFVVVPIALLFGVFVLRWGVNARRASHDRRAAQAAAKAEADAQEAHAAAAKQAADIRHRSVAIYGYALASKFGDAGATAAALTDQTIAVELDSMFPVSGADRFLTGRIDPLDPVSKLDTVALDSTRRLHRVAILLDQALASLTQSVELIEPCAIKVQLFLPSGTAPLPPELFQPLFAALWRTHAWANHPAQFDFPVGQSIYTMIDEYIDQSGNSPNPPLQLFLAADSWMDADVLDSLAARRELHIGKTVGMVPGEAAAALLIGPSHLATTNNPNTPALGALARLRRPKFIEHGSRNGRRPAPDSAPLPQAVIAALEHAQTNAEAIAVVCCDGDSRAGRSAEVAAMMSRALPSLEPIHDQRTSMSALGHCGAASSLLPIVLACAEARTNEKATLAVSVGEDRHSAAVVIEPWPPEVPVSA
jgi:hypothetical protein